MPRSSRLAQCSRMRPSSTWNQCDWLAANSRPVGGGGRCRCRRPRRTRPPGGVSPVHRRVDRDQVPVGDGVVDVVAQVRERGPPAAWDSLTAQPGEDPDRTGVVGLSFGFKEAIGAATVDPRVRAEIAEAHATVPAHKQWLPDEYSVAGTVDAEDLEAEVIGSGEPIVVIQAALTADEPRPLSQYLARGGDYQIVHYHRRGYAGSGPARRQGWVPPEAAEAGDTGALIGTIGAAPRRVRPAGPDPTPLTPSSELVPTKCHITTHRGTLPGLATYQDANRRNATPNTVTAMKRSADSRRCPRCGRGSALVRFSEDWGMGVSCRWPNVQLRTSDLDA